MEEVWKDIPGFEGFYQASSWGQIRSLDRYSNYKDKGLIALRKGKILSQKTTRKGYLEVTLTLDGKLISKRVHRLVALTFIPNPNNYPQINHINEDKKDNRVENLEWCTSRQNTEAYHKSRIQVFQYTLQGKLLKIWHSITKAAESIGLDKSGIQHCCNGNKLKTYGGYIWSYKSLSFDKIKERKDNRRLVQVLQIDSTGNIIHSYKSVANAAKAVGCNPSAITMACNGLRKTIKGYQWRKN